MTKFDEEDRPVVITLSVRDVLFDVKTRTSLITALIIVILIVAAAILFGREKQGPTPITVTNHTESNKTSTGSHSGSSLPKGKPTYLFFYDTGCPACSLMERTTLSNQTILNVLSQNFTFHRVEAGRNPDLSRRYGIMYVPTNIFTYPNGTEIGRVVGAVGQENFMKVLDKVLEIYYGQHRT